MVVVVCKPIIVFSLGPKLNNYVNLKYLPALVWCTGPVLLARFHLLAVLLYLISIIFLNTYVIIFCFLISLKRFSYSSFSSIIPVDLNLYLIILHSSICGWWSSRILQYWQGMILRECFRKKSHKLGLLAQPPLTPTYLRNLGPLNPS